MSQAQTQLDQARAAFAQASDLLAQHAAEQTRVDQVGAPSLQVIAEAKKLRQQRADLMARLIKQGESPATAAELSAIDKAIRSGLADEQRAQDMLEAQATVLAELQRDGAALASRLEDARRNLLKARHAVAELEIMDGALVEFLAAADAMRVAYGKLAGMGAAHQENAQLLNKSIGAGVYAVGDRFPQAEILLDVRGFNLQSFGVLNRVKLDAKDLIQSAKADALGRWASKEQ